MSQLGLVLPSALSASMGDVVRVAQLAEAAGFDAVFTSDDFDDSLANAEAAALSTQRVQVGTCIAKIYLRHPRVTAAGAAAIHELSDGRMILGLGVGGQRLDDGWAIRWRKPLSAIGDYVKVVRAAFGGRPAPLIYLAARGPRMTHLAGRIADGVMFHLLSPRRLQQALAALRQGEKEAGRSPGSVTVSLCVSICVSDDLAAARNAARSLFAFWMGKGYARDIAPRSLVARGDRKAMSDAISDAIVDDLAIVGPTARCREQLQALYAAGVQLPILDPLASGSDWQTGLAAILESFRRRSA